MPIDFPAEPEVGEIYTYNDRAWTWSGEVWTPNRATYTADRDIISDADGYLVASDVTSTEVGYLDGLTGNIQNQLDDKAPKASPAFTGEPTAPTATADQNDTAIATTAFVIGQAASADPVADGTAAPGTSVKYAREDHVHPTDTSRASTTSPAISTSITTASTTFGLIDTGATTVNFAGAATTCNFGYDGTATNNINLGIGSTASGNFKTVNS
jgi:hypothetical protein